MDLSQRQDQLIDNLESSASRLGSLAERSSGDISSSLQQLSRALQTSSVANIPPTGATSLASTEQLMRELSHSLSTPLSQVRSLARTILPTLPGLEPTTKQSAEAALAQIITHAEVCLSFIRAFRALVAFDRDGVLTSGSLCDAIREATQVYAQRSDATTPLTVELPASIEGYGNDYLLAVLLPLIENAVEASPPRAPVIITCAETDTGTRVIMTNHSTTSLPPDVSEAGVTTKKGHEGLGLFTVSHLLSVHAGAALALHMEGSLVTTEVPLPKATQLGELSNDG